MSKRTAKECSNRMANVFTFWDMFSILNSKANYYYNNKWNFWSWNFKGGFNGINFDEDETLLQKLREKKGEKSLKRRNSLPVTAILLVGQVRKSLCSIYLFLGNSTFAVGPEAIDKKAMWSLKHFENHIIRISTSSNLNVQPQIFNQQAEPSNKLWAAWICNGFHSTCKTYTRSQTQFQPGRS